MRSGTRPRSRFKRTSGSPWLVLERAGRHLAREARTGLRAGDSVLTLPISGAVSRGRALLSTTIEDAAGHHHTWTRTVIIPRG